MMNGKICAPSCEYCGEPMTFERMTPKSSLIPELRTFVCTANGQRSPNGHFTNFAVVLLSRRPLTVRTLIHPHVLLRPPVDLSTGRATKWHLYPRRQRLEHYRF